jgi:hypothetical protein
MHPLMGRLGPAGGTEDRACRFAAAAARLVRAFTALLTRYSGSPEPGSTLTTSKTPQGAFVSALRSMPETSTCTSDATDDTTHQTIGASVIIDAKGGTFTALLEGRLLLRVGTFMAGWEH